MLKISIIYKIKKNIWGGGNSFLKNLKDNFIKKKLYTNELSNADIILFNGHQDLFCVLFNKLRFPKKVFIHRFDGPMQDARLIGSNLDKFLYYYNEIIADGTIFQSEFSRKKNIFYGYKSKNYNTVIHNFVSSKIFNTKDKKINNKRIRICCSSFSTNKNKGLVDLKTLDKKIDFSRIELFHIGKITYRLNNIKLIPPKDHLEYSNILKTSQYFLTLSHFECCSNSVLEAIGTGNRIIYRENSGISEIAGTDSIEFKDLKNLIGIINNLKKNKENYINKTDTETLNKKGVEDYINFFNKIIKNKKKFNYYKIIFFLKLILLYYKFKIINFIKKIKS